MSATTSFLAFDLGASSGRAVLGTLDGHRLQLEELHRFPNGPVAVRGHLYWDILRLFEEIKTGLTRCAARDIRPEGVGIDTWGVDAALLTADGDLVGSPYHYRDSRTHGLFAKAFRRVPREQIYATTGIQFMEINTLYQLLAAATQQPRLLATAQRLLFIPDLLSFWLTGAMHSEYTIASTSQLLDAHARDWARDLSAQLGLPADIFLPLVRPGTVVGPLLPAITAETGLAAEFVATASHDTAAAVAAVPARGDDWAYISSGTWSLVGAEVPEPVCTPTALRYNFTNEGGIDGTIRLLKNVAGLWLLQECKRTWDAHGTALSFDELAAHAQSTLPRQAWIDPDDPVFADPGDMPTRIRAWCTRTGQRAPETPGALTRCILESLALKYRVTLAHLQELTQRPIRRVHIVGGGIHNTLLCQLTADVTGLPVIAGPAEATAAGNILVQARARGHVRSLADIREIMTASTPLQHYEPQRSSDWDEPAARFATLLAT